MMFDGIDKGGNGDDGSNNEFNNLLWKLVPHLDGKDKSLTCCVLMALVESILDTMMGKDKDFICISILTEIVKHLSDEGGEKLINLIEELSDE